MEYWEAGIICKVDANSRSADQAHTPSAFLPWCSSIWTPPSFLGEALICLFAGSLYRSTTRPWAHWTRVPTSPARGAKCSSFGMKPTTSLWVCTPGPPTPSPSRPAQQRALGPLLPPGSPPKFQVSVLGRGKEERWWWWFFPFLIFLGVKKGRANHHHVTWEKQGRCSPLCVSAVISWRNPNPWTS